MSWHSLVGGRALHSLTTIPTSVNGWFLVIMITIATTVFAAFFASASRFVNIQIDFDPPWREQNEQNDRKEHEEVQHKGCFSYLHWSFKPFSAFLFPSLAEELFWRGLLIGPPSIPTEGSLMGYSSQQLIIAGIVLVLHVLIHPLVGYTCWPRGRGLFGDWRFLVGALIVLGGATLSFLVSGASVWAAALTHGICVALWRDFFGGETKMMMSGKGESSFDIKEDGERPKRVGKEEN